MRSRTPRQGDQYAISLGTDLAANPDTSLGAALSEIYVKDAEVTGVTVNGGSGLASSPLLGASSIVG